MINKANPRFLVLGVLALLLLSLVVTRWVKGWGLVTIHANDIPLAQVIASIERQGHVGVITSLDLTKPISMDVEKVSPAEALDTLSANLDADWRALFIVAPTKDSLAGAVDAMKASGYVDRWTRLFYPMPSLTGAGGEASDPRILAWKPEGTNPSLASILDEAAQKSGAMIIYPSEWSPTTTTYPKEEPLRKALTTLATSVHGQSGEFFLLTKMNRWGGGESNSDREGRAATDDGSNQRGPARMNPAWRKERFQAQIQSLPPSEQEEAVKMVAEMESIHNQLEGLPRNEREAKFRELAANSSMAQSMEDRRNLRDSKMSPQQRISKAVSYIARKQAMQSSQATKP